MLSIQYRMLIALFLTLFISLPALSGTIRVHYDGSDPANIEAFKALIADFEKEFPTIKVDYTQHQREEYKRLLKRLLSEGNTPDITSWYPGNPLKPYVEEGLIEDVSDLWQKNNYDDFLSSTSSLFTFDDKKYGVPYTHYQWGLYYRKDIFKNLNISPPTNWNEFLQACETLKNNEVTPITVGSKALWPLAGIFTQLNMRINGYDTHKALTQGEIRYSDPKIAEVFDHLGMLVENGYIVEDHYKWTWQEGLLPMVKGEAAMYVIGNFAVEQFTVAGLDKENIGFISFPNIIDGIPKSEEAPVDSFHIPARAKNKEDAKVFLNYLVRADVQTKANKTLGQLPVNSNASVDESDPLLVAGFKTLSAASNLGQFYDRDADSQMAFAAMRGMQEFMINPKRKDRILKRLDGIQERINNRNK